MAQITAYRKTTGEPIMVDESWKTRWPDDFLWEKPQKHRSKRPAKTLTPAEPGNDERNSE